MEDYESKNSKEIEVDIKKLSVTKEVKFNYLIKIIKKHFGKYRIRGSHYIFKVPWKGDPRITIQRQKNDKKMAKPYQVKQVIDALEKLKEN